MAKQYTVTVDGTGHQGSVMATKAVRPTLGILDGTGRQGCVRPRCVHRSIPGMVRGRGLCPYHWAEWVWGRDWARRCYPTFGALAVNLADHERA